MEPQNKERIKQLLTDTMVLLCKNGINYNSEFSINALIGITVDKSDIILISINETLFSAGSVTTPPSHKPEPVLCKSRRTDSEASAQNEYTRADLESSQEKRIDEDKLNCKQLRHSDAVTQKTSLGVKENSIRSVNSTEFTASNSSADENSDKNKSSHNLKSINAESDLSTVYVVKEELVEEPVMVPDCIDKLTQANEHATGKYSMNERCDVRPEVLDRYNGQVDMNRSSLQILDNVVDKLETDSNSDTLAEMKNQTGKRKREENEDSVSSIVTHRVVIESNTSRSMTLGEKSEVDRSNASREGCSNITQTIDNDNTDSMKYVIHGVDDSEDDFESDDSEDDDESCVYLGQDSKAAQSRHTVSASQNRRLNFNDYRVSRDAELSPGGTSALNFMSDTSTNSYRAILPKVVSLSGPYIFPNPVPLSDWIQSADQSFSTPRRMIVNNGRNIDISSTRILSSHTMPRGPTSSLAEQDQQYSAQSGEGGGTMDEKRRKMHKRKSRIAFSPYQIKCLEEVFLRTQYPLPDEKHYLCQNLNLKNAEIKGWFKNRRSKFKKDNLYPITPVRLEMPEVMSSHAKRINDWLNVHNSAGRSIGGEPVYDVQDIDCNFDGDMKVEDE